jgi:hypothetical protein
VAWLLGPRLLARRCPDPPSPGSTTYIVYIHYNDTWHNYLFVWLRGPVSRALTVRIRTRAPGLLL